ncbi:MULTISPECIES: hypothetical protein [unclassified Micromonospora]|uniref:hypothetical protein n=1 Tax=unclassified Micromonospora TaxID=2617518 RepID=UPI002FEF90C2
MTAIWGSDPTGNWQPLAASQYPAEQALHDLVAEGPQMLPLSGAPRLTVLGTEVRLGTGRADVVAVESSGRLVVIEVKLAGNPEARRAVVAQVLSYAAYLQGLDPDYLESTTLGAHLAQRKVKSIVEAVRNDDQEGSVDSASFADGLARSLADGAFRLVIVLDSVPDELVQLVGYLEAITDRVVIDLVTVTAYDVGQSRVLVPQRIDPGRRVAELSEAEAAARQANALQPGSADFRTVAAKAPTEYQQMLEQLIDWAEALDANHLISLATYTGKNEITTLLPRLTREGGGLATIYCEPKGAYLQLWPSVFKRLAPNAIPLVERELGGPIRQGQRINAVSDSLLGALTSAYYEANGRPAPSSLS